MSNEGTAPPKVCISVLNWNSYAHTIACLTAIEKLDYPHYYVLVVDNASTDDSVAHIHETFPTVRIIQAETNLGYAAGNALALAEASADAETELFWILNNDAEAAADSLSKLVNAYKHFGIALYGGVPLLRDTVPWKINQLVLTKFLKSTRFIYTTKLSQLPYDVCFPSKEPQQVNNLHGSTFLIPLSVVQQHGFMDNVFFLYGEENDYCLRLKQHHIPSMLVPESVVFHAGSGSSTSQRNLEPVLQYYRSRNLLLIFKRHSGFVYYHAQLIYSLVKLAKIILSRKRISIRYNLLGIRDCMIERLGKTLAPEDFVD